MNDIFLRVQWRIDAYLDRNKHNPTDLISSRKFKFPTELRDLTATLVVFCGEGGKPHFHISADGVVVASIRLDAPKYYFHKESHWILTKAQRNALIRVLSSPYTSNVPRSTDGPITVWQYLSYCWNADCRNYRGVKWKNTSMPDYTKLKVRGYNRHMCNQRGWINF